MKRKRKQNKSSDWQGDSTPSDMPMPNKANKGVKSKAPQGKRNKKQNNIWEKGKTVLETIPKWMYVTSTFIAGIFAILGAIASIISANAAKESVVAANKSIDISEQSLRISNRAYVHATSASIDTSDRNLPKIKVHIFNNGFTPAYKLKTNGMQGYHRIQCYPNLVFKNISGIRSTAIVPQKDRKDKILKVDTPELLQSFNDAMKGNHFLHVYGWITYNTIFAEQCSTIYSMTYDISREGFTFCSTNNDDYRKINNEWVKVPR